MKIECSGLHFTARERAAVTSVSFSKYCIFTYWEITYWLIMCFSVHFARDSWVLSALCKSKLTAKHWILINGEKIRNDERTFLITEWNQQSQYSHNDKYFRIYGPLIKFSYMSEYVSIHICKISSTCITYVRFGMYIFISIYIRMYVYIRYGILFFRNYYVELTQV